jgi:ATP-dependent RNA helicase DeaD
VTSHESLEGESTFASLGLRPELLSTLSALGYEEPTPIQAATIPVLVGGSDLLGQAATGTGKTAAFALPILELLDPQPRGKGPTALVLVPTRELALQVSQAFHSYGRELGARLVAIYGGAPARHQVDALRRGVDVVVATPGRALDLNRRGALRLDEVRTVVLDEADEMLEMGFVEDIETILALTPTERQTVLFSATMPKRIDKLASQHLRHPERISIRATEPAHDDVPRVRQTAYIVTRQNKAAALGRILDAEDPVASIVFCRTRGGVDDLTDLLTARGYQAEALHGGLTQDQRDRVMGRLRAGTTELLVATDVAARGLDVDHLSHVVNYDLPMSPEAYVHRIGRVGRAGREGVALSLVEPRERRMLATIEKLMRTKVRVEPVPTVTDVRALRLRRTRDAIEELLDDPEAQLRLDTYRETLDDLLLHRDAADVALAAFALAHEETQGAAADEDDRDLTAGIPTGGDGAHPKHAKKGHRDAGPSDGPAKRRPRLEGPTTRLFISVGRKAGVTPGDLVGAITGEAGLKGKDIGAITVHETFSLVEVPEDKARKIAKAMNHCTIRGRKASVRLDRG